MSNEEFFTVTLPLENFKPYYRGREMPDGEPLDTTNITMFEFQIYGGVYMPIKQRGVSALEIETVAAVSTWHSSHDERRRSASWGTSLLFPI